MRASITFDPAQHAWRATGRRDLEPAFRRARRHSRVVRLLRAGIPLALATVVVLHLVSSWLFGLAGVNLPGVGSLGISGSRITMDRPRVAGYTRDGRAYEMVAASAAQDLRSPQLMELQQVRATLQTRDGKTVVITADKGSYDSKNEIVVLRENVRCNTSDGTEVTLAEATVDVRKGHITSDRPVEIVQEGSRIDAKAMEVMDNGAVVHFRGGVKLTTSGSGTMPAVKP